MPQKNSHPTPEGRVRELLDYRMTDSEIEEILHIMDNVVGNSGQEHWIYMKDPPQDEMVRRAIEKGFIRSYNTKQLLEDEHWVFKVEFVVRNEDLQ